VHHGDVAPVPRGNLLPEVLLQELLHSVQLFNRLVAAPAGQGRLGLDADDHLFDFVDDNNIMFLNAPLACAGFPEHWPK
jgi:hypothetical protein